jgi:hypothetical protein
MLDTSHAVLLLVQEVTIAVEGAKSYLVRFRQLLLALRSRH